MYISLWWPQALVGIALILECIAQDELTFAFGQNGAHESTVEFLWPADPDLVLQRSVFLAEGDWETLLGTRGKAEFSAIRQDDRTMFYRLVRLPDSGSFGTTSTALEWRLTEMMIKQIDRAVNPHTTEQGSGLPPDNGDGMHSITKAGTTTPFAWATQPGLIRIYSPNHDGFHRAFKLYSSKDSVASSHQELTTDIANTRSWQSFPNRFTNLNEPIPNADGSKRFPILDPRAMSAGIEGFSFPIDATLGTVTDSALPMPAEWLYVLQDGSLGTLNKAGAWLGNGEATEDNPIVARMAYWTDDETAKLNVNIASEGKPWDVPRADTEQERIYASRQPVNGEVQRYPGHPSMTSLSSILFPNKQSELDDIELNLIYDLTPRVVKRESPTSKRPLTFDSDPDHRVVEDWIDAAKSRGALNADVLHGFVTTSNPAPELSVHGLPRISMWPVRETNNRWNRTEYDQQSNRLSEPYNFLRGDAAARFDEFYRRGNRRNVSLFQYLMHQTYKKTPGYGKALAEKYGARMKVSNYEDERDYDKDHFMIAFSMLDHIRTTNILDFNLDSPYVDPLDADSRGLGTLPGLSLIDRDLKTGTGMPAHSSRWSQPTLEPHAAGRDFTLSELALVAFVTSEAKITAWIDRQPVLESRSGSSIRALDKILQNRHPGYANWRGQKFGPADNGKTFVGIEVGLIPEAFSPSQGTPRKVPIQTLRLLTGGAAYRGGFSASRGLKVNGVPLQLWGEALSRMTERGPLLSTVDESSLSLPDSLLPGWQSMGGAGGPRIFRFGRFELTENGEGWYGRDVLPNDDRASSGWHCQTLVVVEKDAPLVFTQDEAIQIALYSGPQEQASQNNIERLFNFRFAQPRRRFIVPGPKSDASSAYRSWSRRLGSANTSPPSNPFPITEPDGKEVVKGLSVSHGDYRHVALKRVLPSEMFNHHPAATRLSSSHSLTWATKGGASIEPSARQGPTQINRSLVTSVAYAQQSLPDFVQNPKNRAYFAPLLGPRYRFSIDPAITRDFDNGLGNAPDGPYINTSDDGEDQIPNTSVFAPLSPYFEADSTTRDLFGTEHHFARRMAPSPVAFGSIPSAAQANAPWTCLLFRPNLANPTIFPHLGEAGNGMVWERNLSTLEGFEVPQMASIKGDTSYPADHLWLDYFWMPTAQPAETSSPFATQGKVNMNYQLFPYTYIKRATAMHAVFKGEEVMAIPNGAGATYKFGTSKRNFRHAIDADQTLSQFDERFDSGEIFRTASEICEQFLIPEGQIWDSGGGSIRKFWDKHRLTGDNTLERPYAGLYSRLTTQSNAFRMHYRIQTIEKGADSAPDRFDSETDTISEDRRGAKLVERVLRRDDLPDYLDPNSDLASLPRAESFYDVIVRDTE